VQLDQLEPDNMPPNHFDDPSTFAAVPPSPNNPPAPVAPMQQAKLLGCANKSKPLDDFYNSNPKLKPPDDAVEPKPPSCAKATDQSSWRCY